METSLALPLALDWVEWENEFSKCVILYAQFDIFSIHFEWVGEGRMMIVILVVLARQLKEPSLGDHRR